MKRTRLGAAALALAACSGGGADGDAAATCDRLASIRQPAAVFDEIDPTEADEARAALVDAAGRLAPVVAEAPGVVGEPLETIRAAIAEQAAALEPGATPTGAEALEARFAAVAEAEAAVAAWIDDHCG